MKDPRDGGYAWVVLGSACLVNLLNSGCVYTSALFIEAFEQTFSQSCVWLPTAQLTIANGLYVVAGMLADKYGCRTVALIGTGITVVGYIASAFTTSIIQLYITFSFITGAGLALQFIPVMVVVQWYFFKKRALATGILSSCCSSGVFLLPVLQRLLLNTYAWRGTCLILAGLHLQVIPAILLWRPVSFETPQKTCEPDSILTVEHHSQSTCHRSLFGMCCRIACIKKKFCDRSAMIVHTCCICLMFGQTIPYIFLPLKSIKSGYSAWQTALLLSIAGGSEIAGKLVFGGLGSLRQLNMVMLFGGTMLAGGVSALLIGAVTNYEMLAVFGAAFGFFPGGSVCLLSPTLVELIGIEQLGCAYGLACFGGATGICISSIFESRASINLPFFLSGSSLIISSILISGLVIYRRYFRHPQVIVIDEVEVDDVDYDLDQ